VLPFLGLVSCGYFGFLGFLSPPAGKRQWIFKPSAFPFLTHLAKQSLRALSQLGPCELAKKSLLLGTALRCVEFDRLRKGGLLTLPKAGVKGAENHWGKPFELKS